GPAHGQLTLNTDGSFTYTAATGFHGTDSFTYDDTDATGLTSNVATATITVAAIDTGFAPLSISDAAHDVSAPRVGDVLQANIGTDPDGGQGAVSYAWFHNGQAIANATGQTYTVAAGDVGEKITVQATYVDVSGFHDSPTSGPTGNV